MSLEPIPDVCSRVVVFSSPSDTRMIFIAGIHVLPISAIEPVRSLVVRYDKRSVLLLSLSSSLLSSSCFPQKVVARAIVRTEGWRDAGRN